MKGYALGMERKNEGKNERERNRDDARAVQVFPEMEVQEKCKPGPVEKMSYSSFGAMDEPFHDGLQVGLLLGADAVAADLAMADGLEVEGFDQLVDRQLVRQVRLVAQHQQRDPVEFRFLQQRVQLVARDGQRLLVGRIHDESDSISVNQSTGTRISQAILNRQRTRWRSRLDNIAPTWCETAAGHPDPSYLVATRQRPRSSPDAMRCGSDHFNVTWPFWTRFMLKPTVGIELDARKYPHQPRSRLDPKTT